MTSESGDPGMRGGATERQPSRDPRRHPWGVASSALRGHSRWFLVLTLLLGACAGGAFGSSTPEACAGALLEGELIADDAAGFLVRHAEGFVTAVIWPDGYVVRDGEVRELVGPGGQVVAEDGDSVSIGGGMIGADTAFAVCGEFTVTRRD